MSTKDLPPFLKQSKNDLHKKFVDLEWKQRDRLLASTQKPPHEFAQPQGDHITTRNRYGNIVPFERNRIKLPSDAGSNDYINASAIQLGDRHYIATQGPIESGINHFYRMLDLQTKGTAVVVMLTQTHESGRVKCFQYYPLSSSHATLSIPKDSDATDGFHGSVQLTSCEDDAETRSQIRQMKLKIEINGAEPRERQIVHYLFSGWPDFLVPEEEDKAALIRLLEISAETSGTPIHDAHPANGSAEAQPRNPRIIHCSAGVGRSGTFIALDYLLSELYAGHFDGLTTKRDPVEEVVDSLRKQRMMMVQGEVQFYFVYAVLKEKMLERLQAGKAKS